MVDLTSETDCLVITDARSGTDIEIYYTPPETDEIVQYLSDVIKRTGNNIKVDADKKISHVLNRITGIKDGTLMANGKVISTDPSSPEYLPEWKDLLKKKLNHVLLIAAYNIYEATSIKTPYDMVIPGNTIPLEKS